MNSTPKIEVIKRGDNLYHATIDGQPVPIKAAKYKNVARRNAAQWLKEQEQTSWRDVLNDILDRQQSFYDGLEKE